LRLYILKPDAIGDFILATGAIRHLADHCGEANLTLAVRNDVAPLAAHQFPEAEVLPLVFRSKRRVLNVTTVNIIANLPTWLRLAARRYDASLCLRSMRAYLHTILFHTPRATRRIACTNALLASPRVRRPAVENTARRLFHPILIPYPRPEPGAPSEIEANRLVVAETLGRPITLEEVLPTLRVKDSAPPTGDWILAPFSSSPTKDYPAESWGAALDELRDARGAARLVLTGSPAQSQRLQEFATTLRHAGIDHIEIQPPLPLPKFISSLASARLVLTVDTAAAHMACALRRPAVIVSSGLHHGTYGPYSPDGRQTWLLPTHDTPRPAWRQNIPPARIAAAIRDLPLDPGF
jgi:ADP-heptose:LPS heptosyltransferase